MIKFFRRIRQNILIENLPTSDGTAQQAGKTGLPTEASTKVGKPASRRHRLWPPATSQKWRYLKYAIGEIVLVVVGILIALQINTWNENRKLDNKKENYYRQIILDLESDKDYSKSLISKFEVELKKYDNYKESFEVPGLNAYKTIVNIGKLQIGGQSIDFKTNTIKTLASTGDINLLPENINSALITYIANQNKMLEGNNKNANAMLEIITKAVMSGANQSLWKRILIHPELTNELKLEDNYPQIVLELEAYHLLKGVTSNTSINRLNDLIEDADLTIDIIQKELEK